MTKQLMLHVHSPINRQKCAAKRKQSQKVTVKFKQLNTLSSDLSIAKSTKSKINI